MKYKIPCSVEIIRLFTNFDEEFGTFTWRERDRHHFTSHTSFLRWNKRYAGDMAMNSVDTKGYMYGTVSGSRCLAHRAAWAYVNGLWPDGEVDHINGIRTDNRICNLRVVNRSVNQRNAKMKSNNTSGHVGVNFHKPSGLWRAQVGNKHIGYFKIIDDAVRARDIFSSGMGYTDRHGEPFCASVKMEKL